MLNQNPNTGKRKASRATSNQPRLSCHRGELTANGTPIRSGVTVVHADPSYLRRYGAAAAISAARNGRNVGGVTLTKS